MLDGFGSGFHPHPMIANSGRHPNIHGHHDMMLSPFGGFPGPSFMGNIMGQMVMLFNFYFSACNIYSVF
jgi:hypothetical protein